MDDTRRTVVETDVKEIRKKLRNRQSAQRARDRQKARMRWLEREVALLTMRNQALQHENATMRNLFGDKGILAYQYNTEEYYTVIRFLWLTITPSS